MLEFQPRNLSFRVSAYNLSTSYPGTFREAIRVISARGTRPCMLMAGKGEGRVMRRRRKSVRNVDDHRRGSIMARISRFYYFNAGRRGPRDSHTHSLTFTDPRMGIVSFTAALRLYRFLSLSSFATLRSKIDRFVGVKFVHSGWKS